MPRSQFKAGDYFLMPYAGSRFERLIRAVQPSSISWNQWTVERVAIGSTMSGYVLLTSCQRVGPAEAAKIIKAANPSGAQHDK